jgi:peptide deformylase
MARLPIFVAPDPCLKVKAKAVDEVDADIKQLMDDMMEPMHAANGIGLAAPQVGKALQVLVIDIAKVDEKPQPLFMANPEITWISEDLVLREEGCLSLPEQFAEVKRPAAVQVSYLDRDNAPQTLHADGLLARCVQHEIDHLQGTLFVDHISKLKRSMILRKLQKSRRGEPETV